MDLSNARHALCRELDYRFSDPDLLARALTHRSKNADNYERLEFLGDSVLNFTISSLLYDRYPDLSEGELTRLRAGLVKKETLAGLARKYEIGGCLEMGGGELKSGGFERDSILADALEAVIGAVYSDGGVASARAVITRIYQSTLDSLSPQSLQKDPKTRLQELLQRRSAQLPVYNVLEVSGEPHKQLFLVECLVPGIDEPVQGHGVTRRGAEQQAAAKAFGLLTKH